MELLERQKNKVLNYKIAENIENTFWFDLTLGIFKYGTILRKRPVCPGVPVNRLVPVSRPKFPSRYTPRWKSSIEVHFGN